MTSTKAIKQASVGVVAIALAVLIFVNVGGMTGKSAVAACDADVQTVETAVSAFQVHNPSLPISPASLISSSDGGRFLTSWPKNGSHYSIAVTSAGVVMVSAPATAAAHASGTSNPCRSAT